MLPAYLLTFISRPKATSHFPVGHFYTLLISPGGLLTAPVLKVRLPSKPTVVDIKSFNTPGFSEWLSNLQSVLRLSFL